MLKWDKNNDVIYCDYNGELAETWFTIMEAEVVEEYIQIPVRVQLFLN